MISTCVRLSFHILFLVEALNAYHVHLVRKLCNVGDSAANFACQRGPKVCSTDVSQLAFLNIVLLIAAVRHGNVSMSFHRHVTRRRQGPTKEGSHRAPSTTQTTSGAKAAGVDSRGERSSTSRAEAMHEASRTTCAKGGEVQWLNILMCVTLMLLRSCCTFRMVFFFGGLRSFCHTVKQRRTERLETQNADK